MLIVVDIDGTVANIQHRTHYVRTQPRNYEAFAKAIPLDSPEEEVIEVIRSLASNPDNTVIFASGRSEDSREATEDWLNLHVKNWYTSEYLQIYMRKSGDHRQDDVIKSEILQEIIKDYDKKPDLAIDDRLSVCRMWHREGIKLLRCGNPDLDNDFTIRKDT